MKRRFTRLSPQPRTGAREAEEVATCLRLALSQDSDAGPEDIEGLDPDDGVIGKLQRQRSYSPRRVRVGGASVPLRTNRP